MDGSRSPKKAESGRWVRRIKGRGQVDAQERSGWGRVNGPEKSGGVARWIL